MSGTKSFKALELGVPEIRAPKLEERCSVSLCGVVDSWMASWLHHLGVLGRRSDKSEVRPIRHPGRQWIKAWDESMAEHAGQEVGVC